MSFHENAARSYMAPRTAARIAREVQELLKSPETGVRLIVDEATGMPASLQEITAELEGPADTPYTGKFFLMRFTFGPEFPTTPPTAHFLTKVYHPNIDMTTGAICVNTLKRDWKAEHTLKHCLAVIRCLLLQPFPDSALNEDAGKLFMESYNEYYKRAQLHADVHGRMSSVSLEFKKEPETRVLQTSSSRNSSVVVTKDGKKTKTKSLTKKKSLKRL